MTVRHKGRDDAVDNDSNVDYENDEDKDGDDDDWQVPGHEADERM